MSKQTRVAIAVALVAIAGFGAAFAYQLLAAPGPVDSSARTSTVVRSDSHRLGDEGDGKVTLVEFLDFECESCRAAYPFIEQLRARYAGEVTFVVRYFPIQSHRNADNAAYAVESAARQGKFEDMYKQMFETQLEWGERQDSQAKLFRSYAKDLGLDMSTYDQDVTSPAVAARVKRDVEDGMALGVSGTPTFFLDGKKLVAGSTEEFTLAIDRALAR
ncbi:thioredoxin domain-containing protein [Aeromicrobium sp.]|uniref:DsbA family protein n=1 Tax=Aeromicrobium sp. TaxID=1871063 RepID=UPI0030C0FA5A